MNKSVIELAKEAGLAWVARKRLERFAALVRAEALADSVVKESLTTDDHIPDATKMVADN